MKKERIRALIYVFAVLASFSFIACSDNGGGAPQALPSGFTVDLSGGMGGPASGPGGDGGDLDINAYGDIEILRSGGVDTSFSLPGSLPSYRAGVDEAAFSSDTTIPAINNTDPVPTTDNPNGYYMVFGSGNLYMAAGTNANTASDTQADSLSVADGATLTLALNYDFNTDGDANESTGSDTARLDIQGDVQINGTLTVLPLNSANSPDSAYTPDSGAVEIEAINLFVGANGVVSTAGDDSATDHGGHGGQLRLEARNGPGNLLNIMGTIDASGGDALSSSGDGGIGAARLSGSGFIPGSSEGIHLESADGMVVVSGPVASSGGDGENGLDPTAPAAILTVLTSREIKLASTSLPV
jgi:hypothetical protein